jgi:predicted RNase H-like HicB family nuclease
MSVHEVQYTVRVHHEDDGSYWAQVKELPGCFASGDTLDELWEALQEAISLYLADDCESVEITETSVTQPMQVDEMRVKVPA